MLARLLTDLPQGRKFAGLLTLNGLVAPMSSFTVEVPRMIVFVGCWLLSMKSCALPGWCVMLQCFQAESCTFGSVILKPLRPLMLRPATSTFWACVEDKAEQQIRFLDSLWQHLGRLPRRNIVLVNGDFNMTLPSSLPLLGPVCKADAESLCEPPEKFLQLSISFGLCAVSSWGPATSFTSSGPTGLTRFVDYMLMRHDQVDAQTKRVQFLYSHPHATAAEARHIPMSCSWTLAWFPWRRAGHSKPSLNIALAHASSESQQECERQLAQALELVGSGVNMTAS